MAVGGPGSGVVGRRGLGGAAGALSPAAAAAAAGAEGGTAGAHFPGERTAAGKAAAVRDTPTHAQRHCRHATKHHAMGCAALSCPAHNLAL